MSDEEYEYDDDEFEYTDEEEEQEEDDAQADLENAYYNSKSVRDEDAGQAAAGFEEVIAKEMEVDGKPGKYSFKAMKQLVKLHLRTGNYAGVRKDYDRLLNCITQGACSPNAMEKGINGMLERVSSLYQGYSKDAVNEECHKLALVVYETTIHAFDPNTGTLTNERLWFKTNIKYGQLLYEMNETTRLQQVLKELKATIPQNTDEGAGSSSSSTQSMEIYALQIQLYSRQNDNKRLRETFHKAMAVCGGIPHPRTIALIQELGGKMYMANREYDHAEKTFFQAFKSYDEAGDSSRLRCLKYLVLASMLHASAINPFDSQEARPYRDDPEIQAMTNLVQAFHANDVTEFENILKKNKRTLNDEFIAEHVNDLLRTTRTQVVLRVLEPFTRISLAALAKFLNDIPIAEVESLLTRLILKGSLEGSIDQIDMVLYKKSSSPKTERAESMEKVSQKLSELSSQIVASSGRSV